MNLGSPLGKNSTLGLRMATATPESTSKANIPAMMPPWRQPEPCTAQSTSRA